MRTALFLFFLLLVTQASAGPALSLVVPSEAFYDDELATIPVRPGNAFALEADVFDGETAVKNAKVLVSNTDTGASQTAYTNSDGRVTLGQYAGNVEGVWDLQVSVQCLLNSQTGQCDPVDVPAQDIRIAWTQIQVDLTGPTLVQTAAQLEATATWTALDLPVTGARIHFKATGLDAYAFMQDGLAQVTYQQDTEGTYSVVATIEQADRPAAVPITASTPLDVTFSSDAPEQAGNESTESQTATQSNAPLTSDATGTGSQDQVTDSATQNGSLSDEPDSADQNQDSPAVQPLIIALACIALAWGRRRF